MGKSEIGLLTIHGHTGTRAPPKQKTALESHDRPYKKGLVIRVLIAYTPI
jgi:hypothetical protein